jgi:predicted nuclease of predicted toxin-antitoxin system
MRVLLDECVPKRLRNEFAGHDVSTVEESGWAGVTNGRLLAQAAESFDCFLTVDRNLQFQQKLDTLPIAVVVIASSNNKLETLRLAIPEVQRVLGRIKRGEIVVVRV